MGRTSLRPWFMGNKMQFEAVACRLFLHYSYTLAQKASNYGIFCFYDMKSVSDNDYTMVIGLTIFFAILFIGALVVVDIMYGIVDPRIRVAKGKK